MPDTHPRQPPSTSRADVEGFWQDCVLWAHQPRDGVILPMSVAAEVARTVMRDAMGELPSTAMPVEISAYLQRQARHRALQRVAAEREATRDWQVWHDPEWHPDEPLLDIDGLRRHDDSIWRSALPVLRQIALPGIRSLGITDEEDIFSEVLAAIVEPLEGLLVAEQIPPLVKVITRRRAADYLRRQSAAKRDGGLRVEDIETASASTLTEIDLQHILEHSAHAVSSAQWEIITRLILHPTDTHTSLIADARLLTALQIDPHSSEATRRRRLRESLDTALDQIRRTLDLP